MRKLSLVLTATTAFFGMFLLMACPNDMPIKETPEDLFISATHDYANTLIEKDGSAPKPKILIVSHSHDGNSEMTKLARLNHRSYAKKHGYAYKFRTGTLVDKGRFHVPDASDEKVRFGVWWQKTATIQDALEEKDGDKPRWDYVLWLDSDAHFFKTDLDVNEIIKDNNEKHLFIAKDSMFNTEGWYLNAGVLLVKNSDWSHQFFNKVAAIFKFHPAEAGNDQWVMNNVIFNALSIDSSGKLVGQPLGSSVSDVEKLIRSADPKVKIMEQVELNHEFSSPDEQFDPNAFIYHGYHCPDKTACMRKLMELNPIVPAYVINLERSSNRLNNVRKSMEKEGIIFSRFSAIDGMKLSRDQLLASGTLGARWKQPPAPFYVNSLGQTIDYPNLNKSAKFSYPADTVLGMGTAACAMSHRETWTLGKKNTQDYFIVFEDDAVILPYFWDRLMDSLDAIPADWDILFLGSHDEACVSNRINDLIANSNGNFCVSGMYGYVVNANAVDKLLDLTMRFDEEIDVQIARFFGNHLNAYWPLKNISTFSTPPSDRDSTDSKTGHSQH